MLLHIVVIPAEAGIQKRQTGSWAAVGAILGIARIRLTGVVGVCVSVRAKHPIPNVSQVREGVRMLRPYNIPFCRNQAMESAAVSFMGRGRNPSSRVAFSWLLLELLLIIRASSKVKPGTESLIQFQAQAIPAIM